MTETRREMTLRHVLSGRGIVDAQRRIVEDLDKHQHDARHARRLLVLYKQSLAIFEKDLADLDRKTVE